LVTAAHPPADSSQVAAALVPSPGAAPSMGDRSIRTDKAMAQSAAPEERKFWFREAADSGYLPAMHALAMECADPDERRRWLSKAAGEGYVPAMYALAIECDRINKRKRWLTTGRCL